MYFHLVNFSWPTSPHVKAPRFIPLSFLLDVRDNQEMMIFVAAVSGEYISLQVEPTSTINDLVAITSERMGCAPDVIRVLFCGKDLTSDSDGGRTLQNCGIRANVTLYVIHRMIGGMWTEQPAHDDMSQPEPMQSQSLRRLCPKPYSVS